MRCNSASRSLQRAADVAQARRPRHCRRPDRVRPTGPDRSRPGPGPRPAAPDRSVRRTGWPDLRFCPRSRWSLRKVSSRKACCSRRIFSSSPICLRIARSAGLSSASRPLRMFSNISCNWSSIAWASSRAPLRAASSMRSISLSRSCACSCESCGLCSASFAISLAKRCAASRKACISFLISSSLAPRWSASRSACSAARRSRSAWVASPSSICWAIAHSSAATSRRSASLCAWSSDVRACFRPR